MALNNHKNRYMVNVIQNNAENFMKAAAKLDDYKFKQNKQRVNYTYFKNKGCSSENLTLNIEFFATLSPKQYKLFVNRFDAVMDWYKLFFKLNFEN